MGGGGGRWRPTRAGGVGCRGLDCTASGHAEAGLRGSVAVAAALCAGGMARERGIGGASGPWGCADGAGVHGDGHGEGEGEVPGCNGRRGLRTSGAAQRQGGALGSARKGGGSEKEASFRAQRWYQGGGDHIHRQMEGQQRRYGQQEVQRGDLGHGAFRGERGWGEHAGVREKARGRGEGANLSQARLTGSRKVREGAAQGWGMAPACLVAMGSLGETERKVGAKKIRTKAVKEEGRKGAKEEKKVGTASSMGEENDRGAPTSASTGPWEMGRVGMAQS